MKPVKVLLFLIGSLLALVIVCSIFPRNGLKITGGKTLTFPKLSKVFSSEKKDSTASIAEIRKKAEIVDLKQKLSQKKFKNLSDTLELMKVEALESPAQFYFPDDNREIFAKLFEALEKTSHDSSSFRIMHYGDSQIEMDRISSYLRDRLQTTYGGSGPGMLPALEVTPKYTVVQEVAGAWKRKLAFGTEDGRAKHTRYGPMAYFCQKESAVASVVISARDKTSYKNRNFDRCKILIGALTEKLDISISYNNKIQETVSVSPSASEQLVTFKADSSNGKIGLKFSGANADILGIALDGRKGVSLDNVPMRGCSGTMFKKISSSTLKNSYDLLGVDMLILQYGGNSLPGMKSKAQADAYGKKFYDQLVYLKSLKPDMILMVIGPADMSVKIDGTMQTHPQLESVRDALKSATLLAGCVYWDMYAAMGGKNSMVDWVKSKPTLGSPDYIHFTQKGAAKIAEILYRSILKEQEIYHVNKRLGS